MKNQNVKPNKEAPHGTAGVTWQFKVLAGVLAVAFLAIAARIFGLV